MKFYFYKNYKQILNSSLITAKKDVGESVLVAVVFFEMHQ